MDIKKLTITLMVFLILPINACIAGQTVITGTASCVMPDMFEFRNPAIDTTTNTPPTVRTQKDQTPIPSGASGSYEVQKEEKLIQTEETRTETQEGTQADEKPVTVYTICAK